MLKQKGNERTSFNIQPSLFHYGTKMNIRLRIPLQLYMYIFRQVMLTTQTKSNTTQENNLHNISMNPEKKILSPLTAAISSDT
jgi:hypothetical protein